MDEDALTIRQVATLLSVHPNTVRNRIKAGTYRADKVITEHGETYLIPRSELEQQTSTNNVPSPSHSQPLPDVREAMRAMLAPFVEELGAVREELGRERERREQAERRAEDLKRRLEAATARLEATEVPEGAEPRPATGSAQEATQRPWWRRMFGR